MSSMFAPKSSYAMPAAPHKKKPIQKFAWRDNTWPWRHNTYLGTRPHAVAQFFPEPDNNVWHHATHKPTTAHPVSLHSTHQLRVLHMHNGHWLALDCCTWIGRVRQLRTNVAAHKQGQAQHNTRYKSKGKHTRIAYTYAHVGVIHKNEQVVCGSQRVLWYHHREAAHDVQQDLSNRTNQNQY
jgi:hypothetical protein